MRPSRNLIRGAPQSVIYKQQQEQHPHRHPHQYQQPSTGPAASGRLMRRIDTDAPIPRIRAPASGQHLALRLATPFLGTPAYGPYPQHPGSISPRHPLPRHPSPSLPTTPRPPCWHKARPLPWPSAQAARWAVGHDLHRRWAACSLAASRPPGPRAPSRCCAPRP